MEKFLSRFILFISFFLNHYAMEPEKSQERIRERIRMEAFLEHGELDAYTAPQNLEIILNKKRHTRNAALELLYNHVPTELHQSVTNLAVFRASLEKGPKDEEKIEQLIKKLSHLGAQSIIALRWTALANAFKVLGVYDEPFFYFETSAPCVTILNGIREPGSWQDYQEKESALLKETSQPRILREDSDEQMAIAEQEECVVKARETILKLGKRLADQYAINLMVREDNQTGSIIRLLRTLQKDPEFQTWIHSFKLPNRDERGLSFTKWQDEPGMVIYPASGKSQDALKKVYELFKNTKGFREISRDKRGIKELESIYHVYQVFGLMKNFDTPPAFVIPVDHTVPIVENPKKIEFLEINGFPIPSTAGLPTQIVNPIITISQGYDTVTPEQRKRYFEPPQFAYIKPEISGEKNPYLIHPQTDQKIV